MRRDRGCENPAARASPKSRCGKDSRATVERDRGVFDVHVIVRSGNSRINCTDRFLATQTLESVEPNSARPTASARTGRCECRTRFGGMRFGANHAAILMSRMGFHRSANSAKAGVEFLLKPAEGNTTGARSVTDEPLTAPTPSFALRAGRFISSMARRFFRNRPDSLGRRIAARVVWINTGYRQVVADRRIATILSNRVAPLQ